MMCKLPDYILREFRENIDKVTALCSAHFDLVSKMSPKVLIIIYHNHNRIFD